MVDFGEGVGSQSEGGDDRAWMTEARVVDVGYPTVIMILWTIQPLDRLETPDWLYQPWSKLARAALLKISSKSDRWIKSYSTFESPRNQDLLLANLR